MYCLQTFVAGGKARPTLWSATRTGAIICSVLQLAYNEFGVMRIKLVSRQIQEARTQPSPLEDSRQQTTIFDRFLGLIGFRKLSEEEYLQTLKKQRDEALARIAVLEREHREQEQTADSEGKRT